MNDRRALIEPDKRPRLSPADAAVALAILAACVAMRIAALGDTNFHDDDLFYALVGQRMHDGVLPYVGVWDRKPFGLFVIYYLIAGISRSVWAYQIAGWLCLSATGWIVHRLVTGWTGRRQGGLLAGIAYVVITCSFGGENGQAPVFYNLFMAAAFLLTVKEFSWLDQGRVRPGVWAAMLLCGIALTIKQTVVFESLFLGGTILVTLFRSGWKLPRLVLNGAALAAVFSLPMLSIAAGYWSIGHWPEFWNAMVRANLHKQAVGTSKGLIWALAPLVRAAAIAPIAVWTLCRGIGESRTRIFLTGWLIAALIGFLAVPNFFVHYALPLLVPLTVIAGFAFSGARWGRVLFAATLCFDLLWHSPFGFAQTRKSIAAMNLASDLIIRHNGGRGLLVYDGPPYLYALTGKPFLSPLVFPHHLNHAIERDLSHLRTSDEIDRILAQRPGAVVSVLYPRNFPINQDSYDKVRNYAKTHCTIAGIVPMPDQTPPSQLVIFGDCAAKAGASPPALPKS